LISAPLVGDNATIMDHPLLQIDQLLLSPPAHRPTRGTGTSLPHPLSLDFAIGQFHLLAGEDLAPLAQLLRVIAGYDPPAQGRLVMRGQPLSGIPLGARGVATLTADPRLFPQLTVGRNILFPLSGDRRIGDTATAVAGAAMRVGLSAAALDRYPDELDQVTQLRAALARALALGPSLLLLSDPLRDLPAGDAASLLQDLRRLQRELSLTVICATDRLPAWAAVADRVILIETIGGALGGFIQSGSAEDIYLKPDNRTAARLSGAVNLLPVEITAWDGEAVSCRSPLIDPQDFSLPQRQVAPGLWGALATSGREAGVTLEASLLLRPSLLRPGLGIRRQDFRLEGRIQDRFSDGASVMLQVRVPGLATPVVATLPAPAPFPLEQGMAVNLGWNRGEMRLLPNDSAARSTSVADPTKAG
jgi:ABC-type Fe3+/spermidine/putrescine transport system ATPase subunit